MTKDHIVLLGTKGGPAIRPGSSMPTSNLIQMGGQMIVLDCGLGVTRGLVDQGVQLKDLSVIIISHLHSDHYLELGPLIHTAWTAGLKTPVHIYGPDGLSAYWVAFLTSMKADIDLRVDDEGRPDLQDLITIHVVKDGPVTAIGDITVTALHTEHPPLINCFAYAFKNETARVVFSGDTAPLSALEDFARGADLLVHEAMLDAALPALLARIGNGSDKLMHHWRRSHTFAHDAARTAARAGVKALALTHLIPSDDPTFTADHWHRAVQGRWNGPIHIGRDGLRIDL